MGAEFQKHASGCQVLIVSALAHVDILDQPGIYLVAHGFDLLGKGQIGFFVLVAFANQQAHFAHGFAADRDRIFLRVWNAIPMQIENGIGSGFDQRHGRLSAAAVCACIVGVMSFVVHFHGCPQFFQLSGKQVGDIVDAAPFFIAFGAIAFDVAFVAVGAIQRDFSFAHRTHRQTFRHDHQADIRHICRPCFLSVGDQ